ncbi:type IV secretion system protein VirB1 [Sphingomonas carotinifaciens]|nr:type IV secretion system protein VirB1 [Sphingomonas carotinifaciens]
MVPLVVTESGGDALQININKGPRVRARSVSEGVALVRRYVAAGYTVDVGLAQINSANFARLGATIEAVFEPCNNLRLASQMLQSGYGTASRYYAGIDAISATYSLYNTGRLTRGIRNGYVGRIWSTAAKLGSIATAPALPDSGADVATPPSPAPVAARLRQDEWVVGQLRSGTIEVFK